MTERMRVSTSDGKYTIIQQEGGGMTFLRHGEQWPAGDANFSGSGLVLALAQDLEAVRKDFEIVRRAAREFEKAASAWMEVATKAGLPK